MRPPFRLRVCASALILFASHAWALTPSTPAAPSEWKELDGQYYRLDANGDFSCYSEDAWNCKPGAPSRYPELVRPLSCGRDAEKKWEGVTGYDTAGHWCNTAYAKLFAKWHDYDILGWPLRLATNANGDPMCVSTNGLTCTEGEARFAVKPEEMIPLVCGKASASVKRNITGYEKDRPDHWCQSPEIMDQQTDPPLTIHFAPGDFNLETRTFSKPKRRSTASYVFPTLAGLPGSEMVWAARLISTDSMSFRLLRDDGRVTQIKSHATGHMTIRIQPSDPLQYWAHHGRESVPFQSRPYWHDPSVYSADEVTAPARKVGENQLKLTFTSRTPTAWSEVGSPPELAEVVVARKRPAPRISH